jgi:uncharacterized membrane protein YebE (DUF533 family)
MDSQTEKLSAKERAMKKLEQAKARVQKIEARERNELRKARDSELFQAAGLMIVAGLIDTKTGKLIHNTATTVGGLAALRQALVAGGHDAEWQAAGAGLLAAAEKSKRKRSTGPRVQSEEKIREREVAEPGSVVSRSGT